MARDSSLVALRTHIRLSHLAYHPSARYTLVVLLKRPLGTLVLKNLTRTYLNILLRAHTWAPSQLSCIASGL